MAVGLGELLLVMAAFFTGLGGLIAVLDRLESSLFESAATSGKSQEATTVANQTTDLASH